MDELLRLFPEPSDGAPFISDDAVQHIKLPGLLRLCLDEDDADAVIAFLRRPEDAGTLPARREFFEEVLYSEHWVRLFKKVRGELVSAAQFAARYRREKNRELRHFLLYKCVRTYITALTDITAAADFARSGLLRDFIARVAGFCREESVRQAMRDMVALRNAFDAVATRSFETRVFGSFLVGYNTVHPDAAPAPDEQLLALCADMGMGIDTPPPREIKGDALDVYMWLLINNDNTLNHLLFDFHERHTALMRHVSSVGAGDISVLLHVHTLFAFLRGRGVPLCFADISADGTARLTHCRDLSLLTQKLDAIVPNDFVCGVGEGPFILTGVNSGGKTTYLRALGMAVVFFTAGLFVAGASAALPCYKRLEILFAAGSRVRGGARFEQEKKAMDNALDCLGANALLLANELFSSAPEKSALAEYNRILERLRANPCHALLITHLHSLTQDAAPPLVCLLAATGENNERLYKIIRARGRNSNVTEILQKFALTPDRLTAERR